MDFCVRLARALVRTVADDNAFIGDDRRADDRIRSGAAETAARLLQRAAHEPRIRRRGFVAPARQVPAYHFSWNSAST
jgi:hypothetical protein